MLTIELAKRFAPWIALAGLMLVLAFAGPAACRKMARQAAEARIGAAQHEAASESGRDAVATTGAAANRERASDQLSMTNSKEIGDADGADDEVGAGVAAAGIDGLCRRAAYRDDERCQLRGPGAGGVAKGGGGSAAPR